MAMKIRLARGGNKKRPFYRIVAADSRMPRDGRYIEKLGTYNPLLPKDSEERIKMDIERIQYWLGKGAKATDRVSRMLEAASVVGKKERNNPVKGKPGQKALDRAEEKATKEAEAKDAPEEEVVVKENPTNEVTTEEKPAEKDEIPAQKVGSEDTPKEEAKE
ncbi:MAG: 30S ribosomal protein S16 [Rhodobacteraceae bacterium]|nr:30S ribosomal protein S16 [Paracoccaceae bacterium]